MRSTVELMSLIAMIGVVMLVIAHTGIINRILSYNSSVDAAEVQIGYDESMPKNLVDEYNGSFEDIVKALS